MATYTVATDGACMGNPGPAGWAWVADDGRWSAGSPRGPTTSASCSRLLTRSATTPRSRPAPSRPTRCTRSTPTEVDGRAPPPRMEDQQEGADKNVEILRALIAARDARRAAGLPDVTFEHVRGHAGHRLNGWADERAVRARRTAAAGSRRSGRATAVRISSTSPSTRPRRGRTSRSGRAHGVCHDISDALKVNA